MGTMGVNSLPKTVTQQRRECDLNPGPSAPESSTLTTRLPAVNVKEKQTAILETVVNQCPVPCSQRNRMNLVLERPWLGLRPRVGIRVGWDLCHF